MISFKDWLRINAYAESTIYNMPLYLKECLSFVSELNQSEVDRFFEHLKSRKNKRREGGLSAAHINKYRQSLLLYHHYLSSTRKSAPSFHIELLETESSFNFLDQGEIKALYKACSDDEMGIRDRAILSVFYGCALRRNEGYHLNVDDILFDKKRLYVRKTKNKYERYVPLSKPLLKDFENYIYDSRPKSTEKALFLNKTGKRLSKESLYLRIKELLRRSGLSKNIALHSLRHSIASHLLQNGMSLEDISSFLGHRSLESTQIYTHLIKKENDELYSLFRS